MALSLEDSRTMFGISDAHQNIALKPRRKDWKGWKALLQPACATCAACAICGNCVKTGKCNREWSLALCSVCVQTGRGFWGCIEFLLRMWLAFRPSHYKLVSTPIQGMVSACQNHSESRPSESITFAIRREFLCIDSFFSFFRSIWLKSMLTKQGCCQPRMGGTFAFLDFIPSHQGVWMCASDSSTSFYPLRLRAVFLQPLRLP